MYDSGVCIFVVCPCVICVCPCLGTEPYLGVKENILLLDPCPVLHTDKILTEDAVWTCHVQSLLRGPGCAE